MIKNEATINEELDPRLIINRLKREVEELKNQLSISNNGESLAGDLNLDEIEKLKQLVQRFLDDKELDSVTLNVGADMRKINFCFKFLKELHHQLVKAAKSTNSNNSISSTTSNASNIQPNITIVDSSHYDSKELKDLKETLRQRDNEISRIICFVFLVRIND